MTFEVGEYRAIRVLGHGATARVWLGEHLSDGHIAVLTVFPIDLATVVRRQAALAASIAHPHLVSVIGVEIGTEQIAIVSRYAAGGSLQDTLEAGPLTPGQTITVLAGLASALQRCHDQGLIHGGISSAQVMFDSAGKPMLADLGAAPAALEAGLAVGSAPPYASPEMARGAAPTPASDIFGLGAVALHCLTGRPAWPAQDLRDVVIQSSVGQWPDPGGTTAASGVLVGLVRQMLDQDPARRPTATVVLARLRTAEPPEPIDLTRAGAPSTDGRAAPETPPFGRHAGAAAASESDAAESEAAGDPLGAGGQSAAPAVPAPDVQLGDGISWPEVAATPSWSFAAPLLPALGDPDVVDIEPRRSAGSTLRRTDQPEPIEMTELGPGGRRGRNRHAGRNRRLAAGTGTHHDRRRNTGPNRLLRTLAVIVCAGLIAGGSVALGLWWAGADPPDSAPMLSAVSTAAVSTAAVGTAAVGTAAHPPDVPRSGVQGSAAASAIEISGATAEAGTETGTEDAGRWLEIVRELDRLRSQAFTYGDAAALAAVYQAGSDALSIDVERIAVLAAAGYRVDGVEHDITAVVRLDQPGLVLSVTDSMPAYAIRDQTGAIIGRTGERAPGSRILRLVAAPDGYRIADVG